MRFLEGGTDCPVWAYTLGQQHGQVAFDVGANGGSVARIFANSFDRVYAFEPCRESYEAMIDGPANVRPFCMALSDHGGEIELREASRSIQTGQLVTGDSLPWGETVGVRKVRASTVDLMCNILDEWPDLVKIDVEGHEVQVLRGAERLIRNGDASFFIEVHAAKYLPDIEQLLDRYEITRFNHTGYRADDPTRDEHFYVRAVKRGNGR